MARQPDKGLYENFLRRDGRLNRWRYFKRAMLLGVVTVALLIVLLIVAAVTASPQNNFAVKIVLGFMLIPHFCLMVRRLHDMDKGETLAYVYSALQVVYVFIGDFGQGELSPIELVITVISTPIALYILFGSGTKGDNQYGSDPIE